MPEQLQKRFLNYGFNTDLAHIAHEHGH